MICLNSVSFAVSSSFAFTYFHTTACVDPNPPLLSSCPTSVSCYTPSVISRGKRGEGWEWLSMLGKLVRQMNLEICYIGFSDFPPKLCISILHIRFWVCIVHQNGELPKHGSIFPPPFNWSLVFLARLVRVDMKTEFEKFAKITKFIESSQFRNNEIGTSTLSKCAPEPGSPHSKVIVWKTWKRTKS